jgi:hypothetical protein
LLLVSITTFVVVVVVVATAALQLDLALHTLATAASNQMQHLHKTIGRQKKQPQKQFEEALSEIRGACKIKTNQRADVRTIFTCQDSLYQIYSLNIGISIILPCCESNTISHRKRK